MKKYIIFLILTLCLISLASAEIQNLGVFKQNDNIVLTQTCSNCSYVNISSVTYPNSTYALVGEYSMTKNGQAYYYNYTNTTAIGQYIYCGHGDIDGIDTSFCVNFDVTTTGGKVSLSNIIIVIVFLLISGLLFLLGYSFDKTKWLIKSFFFLCSILMLVLSLNSARIIASESLGLSSMADSGFVLVIAVLLVMFLYVFIYWSIENFKSLKEKQGLRWSY